MTRKKYEEKLWEIVKIHCILVFSMIYAWIMKKLNKDPIDTWHD